MEYELLILHKSDHKKSQEAFKLRVTMIAR